MPGYLMRRGSILLDRAPEEPVAELRRMRRAGQRLRRLLDRHLITEGILKRPLLGKAPRRFGGDNAVLGTGEILFPRMTVSLSICRSWPVERGGGAV